MRNRAWRRFQNYKKENKAYLIYYSRFVRSCNNDKKSDIEKEAKKTAKLFKDNLCLCSNPLCCGNPRKQKGKHNPTLKELKFSINNLEF